MVHRRHVQAVPPSIHTVDDDQCLCQEGRPRQAGATPVRTDVKAKESRLPRGTETAPGDPSLSPSSEADHVRLRKSDLHVKLHGCVFHWTQALWRKVR